MSKELPYYKFYVNEWITGDITLEDYEAQGLFINLCAYYWSKDCAITLTNAKRKFKDAKPEAFQSLIDSKIIKVGDADKLIITFLDEQTIDRENLSRTNSQNGKLGGRPKKKKSENKPTALILESETLTKKSNIEEKREEERIVNSIVDRKLKFSQSLKPFLETYGKDTLNQFYTYWAEPNKSNTKFKQELEKTWDLKSRLARWTSNEFSKVKSNITKGATDQSHNVNLFK